MNGVLPIDLRSDTVTQPSDAMRRAMAAAPVGDDVYAEDPTVNALEHRAAELLGKPEAVFVASGTMGNLVSVLSWVPRGGEIIGGAQSHTLNGEAAGYAVLAGASARLLMPGPDGTLGPAEIADAFRDPSQDVHEPISSLVTIENTVNASMGLPLTLEYTERVAKIAHDRGVPLHLDGARLFNAVVALRVPAADLCRPADSVMISLSKGLACPVGAVVAGDHEFIHRVRRARKLVGGGMRQAGIIAAAGLLALQPGPDGMIDRLAEDHANARRLGEGLARYDFLDVDLSRLRTNFVMFRVRSDEANWRETRARFVAALWELGVLTFAHVGDLIRAVTHYGIDEADIDRAIEIVPEAWRSLEAVPAAV
ncbi:MAG TPA: GntG family PLP-dependent aldolase [Candidatus Saccharimonadales bacterium]|nr:GntG family PLP-dependent aldolase [Candidatus Saccharimonadales bacterium]